MREHKGLAHLLGLASGGGIHSPSPYTLLWQEVLLQAFRDAICPTATRADIHWITHPSKDFVEICDLASIDPIFLHEALTRLIRHPRGLEIARSRGVFAATTHGRFHSPKKSRF